MILKNKKKEKAFTSLTQSLPIHEEILSAQQGEKKHC